MGKRVCCYLPNSVFLPADAFWLLNVVLKSYTFITIRLMCRTMALHSTRQTKHSIQTTHSESSSHVMPNVNKRCVNYKRLNSMHIICYYYSNQRRNYIHIYIYVLFDRPYSLKPQSVNLIILLQTYDDHHKFIK